MEDTIISLFNEHFENQIFFAVFQKLPSQLCTKKASISKISIILEQFRDIRSQNLKHKFS